MEQTIKMNWKMVAASIPLEILDQRSTEPRRCQKQTTLSNPKKKVSPLKILTTIVSTEEQLEIKLNTSNPKVAHHSDDEP